MKKRSKCACKVGVLTESSCCDGPPDISILDRLGPPPKPPWISSTDFEAICNNTQYYNPSPGITSPKSDANSTAGHNISSAEIVLISLSLVIVCAVIAALIAYYFYKKRYHSNKRGRPYGKWFKVKPEEAEEDNNFLYNYRMLGRRWEPEGSPERPTARTEDVPTRQKPPRTSRSPRRQPSTDDKAALIAGTPTSQMSLSSSGGDSGEAPPGPTLPHHPHFTPYVRRDDLDPTGTLLSPHGGHGDVISYSDLLPGSGVRDSSAVQNGRHKLGGHADSVGSDDLNSQETSFRGPLPILTPISSSHDPVFKARSFEGSTPSNCDSTLSSLKRPNTLEPLNRDHSENKKRHRKRRKPPSQYNHVAMETISHDAAEIVPIKNGESNA